MDTATRIRTVKQTATYRKLGDGTWGLRVAGPIPTPGQSIVVERANRTKQTEIVGDVLGSWVAREIQITETTIEGR